MGSMPDLPRRKLGTQGLEVSALGLGCNRLAPWAGMRSLPVGGAIDFVKHAFDSGVTFFDTSDIYGPHTSEIALGQAIKNLPREKIQVATKFGMFYKDQRVIIRGDSEYVRKACEASLERLGVDYIDLYYQHRVDKNVPIEDTMGELKKLVGEGKVKYIGLSGASADTIRRAHSVHPVSVIQMEWSLWNRDIEEELIPLCRELGIGIVPYCPLGAGFFAGKGIKEDLDKNDKRHKRNQFDPENLEKNKVLYERVNDLAKKHGCTPSQLALAWLLHQGDMVVPIPGTSNFKHFDENLGSLNVKLCPHEVEEVAAAVPETEVAGFKVGSPVESWKVAHTPLPNAPSPMLQHRDEISQVTLWECIHILYSIMRYS